MMVQIPVKLITLDEFLKQPETKPANEYIDSRVNFCLATIMISVD